MCALEKVGAKVFRIPARSLDLNPIENFFNLVSMKLKNDDIIKKITEESIEETMQNFNSEEIDKIIDSMDKRITAVIKVHGQRTKY